MANRTLIHASRHVRREREVYGIVAESDRTVSLPGIMAFLRRTSPLFRYRLSSPYWTAGHYTVYGPSDWLDDRRVAILWALARPFETESKRLVIARAVNGTEGGPSREELDAVLTDFAFHPRTGSYNNFLDVASRMKPGQITDALSYAAGYHAGLGISTDMNMPRLVQQKFHSVERRHYAATFRRLQGLIGDPSRLEKEIESLYPGRGVPSICLLFAECLNRAGLGEKARVYVRKAVGLYNNLTIATSDDRSQQNYIVIQAFRDLASAPSFYEQALRFYERAVERESDVTYLLGAMVDLARKRNDAAKLNLKLAPSARRSRLRISLIYRGKIYRKPKELHAVLEAELAARTK